MITLWMLYCVVVSLLFGGTAVAMERCLRLHRFAARWVWGVAIVASVGLPLVAIFAPTLLPANTLASKVQGSLGEAAVAMWQAPAAAIGAGGSWVESLDRIVVAAWIVASLCLFTLYAWSVWRLAREVRELPPTQFEGLAVRVSPDMGPAVLGLLRSAIVLPSWALDLDRDLRFLISRHEREHVRAKDHPLLVGALCVPVFLPWNVALWWQYRRLRLAVESDCDLRVLRQGVDARTYSTFLLEVEKRATRSRIPALALARGESSLARRIHLMTWKPRRRTSHTIGAAAIASVLGVLACETPVPNEPPPLEESRVPATQEDNEPLYVIDGVIISSLSQFGIDLDSLDIVGVQVFKGDTATALFGERAKDGVIQITTRLGSDTATLRQSLRLPRAETLRLVADSIVLLRAHHLPDTLRAVELHSEPSMLVAQSNRTLGRAIDLGRLDTLFASPETALMVSDTLYLLSPPETVVVVRADTSGFN